jgi:hypothetical protein
MRKGKGGYDVGHLEIIFGAYGELNVYIYIYSRY